jgi:hypothetical protein
MGESYVDENGEMRFKGKKIKKNGTVIVQEE